MEKDVEKQVLEELESINQTLQDMNENNKKKNPPILFDILKSLFVGVFVVGPIIAVVIVVVQILGSWVFN
ncbi:hypothetical protein [Halobacillus ihumii]|uniref:hypothetical protein n=1 Tax=Halobacillus ihumii TaxID=2686092 RepID=UPI0013D5D9E5|nr:hypothetical protein [Halobacillus ihumii]